MVIPQDWQKQLYNDSELDKSAESTVLCPLAASAASRITLRGMHMKLRISR